MEALQIIISISFFIFLGIGIYIIKKFRKNVPWCASFRECLNKIDLRKSLENFCKKKE
jgi:hypothetical protein